MELCINMLIDWVTADGTQKTERLLWTAPTNERVVLIDIHDRDSMPYDISAPDLLAGEENGDLRVLSVDPHALAVVEAAIPEKHRRRRDRAWALISPIVELANGSAFNASERFRAISRVCSERGVSEVSVYRHLKRFWKRGQTKNALLPDYKNCGAPGRERVPGEVK